MNQCQHIFHLFSILYKNCRLQGDSNSDRQSIRQAWWPKDHRQWLFMMFNKLKYFRIRVWSLRPEIFTRVFLMGQSRPLFCLFSFFSHFNPNDKYIIWKRRRCCAWYSNPGWQDRRRWWFHSAMGDTIFTIVFSFFRKKIDGVGELLRRRWVTCRKHFRRTDLRWRGLRWRPAQSGQGTKTIKHCGYNWCHSR